MKNLLLHGVVAACFSFALTTVPRAQTGTPEYDPLGEFDHLPRQIRVQVEFIDLSHEQLTGLMSGKPAGDGELRNQVAQLVKDGKASVLETLLCTARSGQKATSESIQEFIYPTEYEPALTTEASQSGKAAEGDRTAGPTPTAFETRNLGSTLEIEPTLGENNRIIDLRFVPDLVYHVGNTVWSEWKSENGDSSIQMPRMYSLRINTAVTLEDGKPMLVGALSPKAEDGTTDLTRKLMVFVKADVIVTGR